MESLLFQTSLLAAFVAGMVALFAPCCITFLLPAYLGSVFKEKEKIILMTLVFGLGIFMVLLPAVLGVALISRTLFRYHDAFYLIGAAVMFVVSIISLLGLKLPMPHLPSSPQKTDALSIFTLGIFSGITSACCAPVLIGILALTFLSPNFFGALGIGAMYVLGMIVPLLLISIFLAGKMPKVQILRRNLLTIKILKVEYHVITSNVISAAIFFFTGLLIVVLTLTGKLAMDNVQGFTRMIQDSAMLVDRMVGSSWLINILFISFLALLFYLVSKRV